MHEFLVPAGGPPAGIVALQHQTDVSRADHVIAIVHALDKGRHGHSLRPHQASAWVFVVDVVVAP